MQVKTLLAGIVALALTAGSASAITSAGSGYWDQTSTWSGGVVPSAGAPVNIQNGHTVTIRAASPGADAFASNLDVHGFLVIEGTRMLTLDGGSSTVTTIDSSRSITIGDASNGGATLRVITNSHTLVGPGSVIGAHANSLLEIDKGVRPQDTITLVNSAVVEGKMTAQPYAGSAGSGKSAFLSTPDSANPTLTGIVTANVAGTLEFVSTLILADAAYVNGGNTYLPTWKAETSSSAVLKFDRACNGSSVNFPRLVGNFVLSNCAMFMFLDQVETTGNLTWNAGTVDVNAGAGKQFIYNYGTGSPVTISADTTQNCP